jgi:hypothetical protein
MEFIALGGLTIMGVYSAYRQMNPTLDDLKERKRKREKPIINVIIGETSLQNEKKQIDWEERCIKANQILDY